MELFSGAFPTLERSLDFATTKNKTIASNISNQDTPNYKAKDVAFKDVLSDELTSQITAKRTHVNHKSFQSNRDQHIQVRTRNNTTYNHNGNNVDMDKEMSDLAENQIYHQGLVDRIGGEFNKIQTVLRGGS